MGGEGGEEAEQVGRRRVMVVESAVGLRIRINCLAS